MPSRTCFTAPRARFLADPLPPGPPLPAPSTVPAALGAAAPMRGFGVLSFSPMTSFSQFGMLTAVMILYALIATLLVLPAVVLTVAEYRAAPAFPPRDDAGATGAPNNIWGEPAAPPQRVARRVKKRRKR